MAELAVSLSRFEQWQKVRLYASVGAALIAAREDHLDAFGAITAVIPWERFRATVAEAETLARPQEFDVYQKLGEHYAGIRRWSPAFLDTFRFESVPASASLMRAIDVLREANRTSAATLPESAPTAFVRRRWAPHVLPGGAIDRRHYELCVLAELRDRLRAGDVWVVGSRQYRSFEERLISKETLQDLQQADTLPVAVEADFDRFVESRRALLDERLAAIDARAEGGLLPDVTIDKGVLKIAPIEKSTPPEADALAARLYAMLPRIRITDPGKDRTLAFFQIFFMLGLQHMLGLKSLIASTGFGLLAGAAVLGAPARAENTYDNPARTEWSWSKIERGETVDFNEWCQLKSPLDPRNIDVDSERLWNDPCRALDARFIVEALTKASLRDRIPSYGLDISGARIVGDINLAHEKIARRLSINKSWVQGSVTLETAQASDEVAFTRSRVDGSFSAAAGFHAENAMYLQESEFRNKVDLYYAKIDGLLAMWGAIVKGQVNAEALKVEGDFMMGGASFESVVLDRAIVANSMSMQGATCHGELSAPALQVGGHLFMHGGGRFGTVYLTRASVAGDLEMFDSRFKAVNLTYATIGKTLDLSDATFASLDLSGTSIAADFMMRSSTFNDRLDALALYVGGSVAMSGATLADQVYLAYATIGQNLDLRGAALTSLDLSGATIAGEFQLGKTGWRAAKGKPDELVLRNASIGTLVDDKDGWPSHLKLEGLSFAYLEGVGETRESEARDRGAEWWDEWAQRDHYSPHPYQQLAAAFSRAGDTDLADEIRYKSRAHELQAQHVGMNWLWSWFLQWVAGFGIYPFRVLYWVGGISLVAALYLWKCAKGVRDKGHRFFWCWGASLARLLPVIEINKEFSDFFNDPDRKNLTAWENAAFSLMGIFGWFLAAILIAAVSGITAKP